MTDEKSSDANPYQAPREASSGAEGPFAATSLAIQLRKQLLTSAKSLNQNTLCLVGLFGGFSIVGIQICSEIEKIDERLSFMLLITVLATAGMIVGLPTLWGVRKGAAWSRKPLIILSLLGLMMVPIGTCFGGLILMTLFSRKEPRLLSAEYEQLVLATPELNPRTSFMAWLGGVLLLILAIVLFLVLQLPPEVRHMK